MSDGKTMNLSTAYPSKNADIPQTQNSETTYHGNYFDRLFFLSMCFATMWFTNSSVDTSKEKTIKYNVEPSDKSIDTKNIVEEQGENET